RHAVPAIYQFRAFAAAGGLMSYGASLRDTFRQQGAQTGRILKGAKPAELPVVQSTKYEFVINLQAARAIEVEVPNAVQLLADEVIEGGARSSRCSAARRRGHLRRARSSR